MKVSISRDERYPDHYMSTDTTIGDVIVEVPDALLERFRLIEALYSAMQTEIGDLYERKKEANP